MYEQQRKDMRHNFEDIDRYVFLEKRALSTILFLASIVQESGTLILKSSMHFQALLSTSATSSLHLLESATLD